MSETIENENVNEVAESSIDITETKEFQAEVDRRINQMRENMERKITARVTEQVSEAAKLQSMSELDALKYTNEKLSQQLADMQKQAILADNRKTAIDVMTERNIPISFVDYIIAEDAETMMENINRFDVLFHSEVSNGINSKISSGAKPQASANTHTPTTTQGMSYAERKALKDSNPTLYNQIKRR